MLRWDLALSKRYQSWVVTELRIKEDAKMDGTHSRVKISKYSWRQMVTLPICDALDMTALTLSPRLLHVALKESRADSAL